MKIGDRVGFLIGGRSRPGDIRGHNGRQQLGIQISFVFADVLETVGLGSDEILCVEVHTKFGIDVVDNVKKDPGKTIPDTWHVLA